MTSALRQRVSDIDRRAPGWVIGGARILVGLLWLANLHWKVPPAFGEDSSSGLFKYSESITRNSPFAPFTWVTEELILPNFRFFGWVTLVVELLLAMFLLVGYRTRIVALVGAAWSVPILLSVIYYDRADEWSWSYLMMVGLHLVLYATDAGRHLGLDGLLERGGDAARRGLAIVGSVAAGLGVVGLYVARSVEFAGSETALLGSDAGFVNSDGGITRRWELKLVFFNPLWALLTIVFGAALVIGARRARMVWVSVGGAAGFGAIAIVVFLVKTFDYVRDDGGLPVVSTASNAALWGAFALAGVLLSRRSAAVTVPVADK
jgi:thiosulfate dehydrogenase [quinone] large subunit